MEDVRQAGGKPFPLPAGSRVLYAHLGGVPALNAYSFLFRNG